MLVSLKDAFFHDVADIYVGYEFSLYTTTESIGQVEICAVLMNPGPATAPRDFVLSSTTESGTASMFINSTKFKLNHSYIYPLSAEGTDYLGQTANLTFAAGDSESCHTVVINQDDECEDPVPEDFFANLAYVSGIQNINVVQDRTRVLIDDSNEPECGESRLIS